VIIAREFGTIAAGAGPALEFDTRLVAWNTPGTVSDDGASTYTEVWEPGSLVARADGQVMPVYAGHAPTPWGITHGPLVGRLEPSPGGGDGLYATVVLADTAAARELHALARTVGATVSLEADTPDEAPVAAGSTVRRRADRPSVLTGAAVLTLPARGALPGAAVLAVRSQPTTPEGAPVTMTDDPTTPTPDPVGPDPAPAPATPAPDPDPNMRPIARGEVLEMFRQAAVRAPQLATPAHPLAAFASFGAFADAAYGTGSMYSHLTGGGGDRPLSGQIARAWVDQVTTANPGVIPPAWLTEVFGIVDQGRPLIDAIGTRPLPPAGMEIDWPYFDGDLSTLVGEQATEKTDITSVVVSLKRASAAIKTYAGGSDVSYQLIRRSSPSYRDAYLRIMSAAYGLTTDKAAGTALVAAATGSVAFDPATEDVDALRAALFAASAQVAAATGTPATAVVMATDMFVKFGSALLPSMYGTQNVSGTADASTLRVDISGLGVVMDPYLPDGTIIVTNRSAASWSEDGPMVIAAPDVPKLGEDTAIWGMAALEVPVPAGVVLLAPTVPLGRTSAKS
jgi:hypothetical protein